MPKTVSLILVTLVTLAITASAIAAGNGLRVIGSGRSSGDFAVTAASGQMSNAHALYLRGYGHGLSGMGVVACSRGIASIGSKTTTLSHMTAGRLYRLQMPFAGSCDVTASLSGTGSIRLQVLAR